MPTTYLQCSSSDASEHAAALHEWNQRYEQVSQGRFAGSFTRVQLDDFLVFRETANRTLVQSGRVCTEMVAIGFVRSASDRGRFCGQDLQQGCFFRNTGNSTFQVVTGADWVLDAVSVPQRALDALQADMGEDAPPGGASGPEVMAAATKSNAELQAMMDFALKGAAVSASMQHSQALRMFKLSLAAAVLQCQQPLAKARASRAMVNKQRIVSQARAYMEQHPETVLAVPDVCKAIGTSRRALQYAFEDVLQISPVAYLRLMRLNRVRASLLQPSAGSVGDVAARWGFWHLSRFAADYKSLFGELPSATLQRCSALAPR